MDLSRNMNYTYSMNMQDNGIETLMFMMASDQMLNSTANPTNAVYQIAIDGTTNLTTTFKAPIVSTKGHYYQFSTEAMSSVPMLMYKNGTMIMPMMMNDDTMLSVQPDTGYTTEIQQRTLQNF